MATSPARSHDICSLESAMRDPAVSPGRVSSLSATWAEYPLNERRAMSSRAQSARSFAPRIAHHGSRLLIGHHGMVQSQLAHMVRGLDALTSLTLKHVRERWWNDAFAEFLEGAL